MPDTESKYQSARRFIQRNLVVILPFLVTVWQATDGLTLKDAVPVVVGLVLRQFFTSPTFEVQERIDAAHNRGFDVGRVVGLPRRNKP